MPRILTSNEEIAFYCERMASLAFRLHFAQRLRLSKHQVEYLREQLAYVVRLIGYPLPDDHQNKKGLPNEEER